MSFTSDYLKKKQELTKQQNAPKFTLPTMSSGITQKASTVKPAATSTAAGFTNNSGINNIVSTVSDRIKEINQSIPADVKKAYRENQYATSSIVGSGANTLPNVGRELAFARRSRAGGDTVKQLQDQQNAYLRQQQKNAGRDFWDDFWYGAGYGAERIGADLMGAAENAVDSLGSTTASGLEFLTSLGYTAPNPVSDMFKAGAEGYLNNSPTNDYKASIEERYKPSDAMRTLGDVEGAVANMLPSLAASYLTGGGSALAQSGSSALKFLPSGNNLGLSIMGVQSAGNAAQEAKQEGASLGQSLLYGASSGMLESVTESLFGGIPGLGRGAASQIAEKMLSNPAMRRVLDIIGEGGEEAISAYVTPYIKRQIYDPDAQNATPEEIIQNALMGMAAAGILQAGFELPSAIQTRADVVKQAEANLSDPSFVERTTQEALDQINQRINNRPVFMPDNPLAKMLPTVSEAMYYASGSPAYRGTQSTWIQKEKNRPAIPDAGASAGPEGNAKSELPQGPSKSIILPGGQEVNQQVGPESSVGAARKGFDPYSAFLGTKSDFLPEGADAARPVDVPTTDAQGNPIRKTAATAMGAKAIPDEVVGDIQSMIMSGDLSYKRVTDRDSINRAVSRIKADGFQRSLGDFSDAVQKGVVSKDLATLGQQLLVNAANAGDVNSTAELLSLYAQMETVAGQAVQAASILRKLSPTAQLYAAQKVASNLEKTLSKQLKGENITINPDLITEFNEQTTQEGRDAVMEKIYKDLASQVPSTWKDKWNAWRYLSMLGNPRTHIRNIMGNVGFQPVRFMKDRIAAVIESGVSAASGGKLQRTKSFAYNPALYAAAWQDYNNVADVLSGNKYDDVQSIINNNRTIFKKGLPTKAIEFITGKTLPYGLLEGTRKVSSGALSIEDMWFKRITYADALAGYLAANGVTAEEFLKMKSEEGNKSRAVYQEFALPAGTRVRAADRDNFGEIVSFDEGTNKYLVHFVSPSGHEANVNLDASLIFPVNRAAQRVKVRGESGEVLPSFLQAARDYAGQEALKATYTDRNQFSDAISSLGSYRGDNIFKKAGSELVSAVLPFKRTPANILARGVEYSPIGLVKGLTYDLYQVKQGNMTGAQAIDNIAAGMTGTGLMLLGGLLAAAGVVSGGAGDDEKQAQFNELTGGQTYALNLPGGGSVTLDWLAPEALPFFMGVQAMESFGEEGLTADTITSAFSSISEPMLEMSMLQSLNDLIDSVSYSDMKIPGLIGSALISYLTQAIPTIGGQIERTFEDKRYSTYTNKDSLLPTGAQYALGKASAKIPVWDYQQVPFIDAWGREEETGLLPMRALNNFLNPAYTSSLNVTPVDEEIQRLYNATGVGSVIPSRADKSITVDGEDINLSGDKYVEYAKKKGQTAFDILSSIIDTSAYKSLSDSEKADLISQVYEYANSVGKAAVSNYKPDGLTAKIQQTGVDPADYILYKSTADLDKNGTVTQSESASALLPMKNLTDEEKGKVWQSQNSSWNEKKNPFTGALSSAGIDAKTATSILEKYSEVYNTDMKAGDQAAELSKFLDGLNLTTEQRAVVDDTYKFYNMFPATIKAYNIETMSKSAKEKWPRVQAWGMSEEDYLKYYPMVSSGKKEECLQKLQNAGMTQAQANYFWDLVKSK